MRKYTIISKCALVICLCLILLAAINGFTGFINSIITVSGTLICIGGFCMAIIGIIFLEKERKKTRKLKSVMITD